MKSRLEQLRDRILSLNNIVGEINFQEIEQKHTSTSVIKEKFESISDIIIKMQKEIKENDNITLKDVHKKSKR